MAIVTKEELSQKGVYIDDINGLVKKQSRVIFEPPVKMVNTTIHAAGIIGCYTNLRGGVIRNIKSIGRFCNLAPGFTIGMGEHALHYFKHT